MATTTTQNGDCNHNHEATEVDPLQGRRVEELETKSCMQKCVYALKNVTFEPTMFLFVLSAVLSMMTTQNLYLEKACRVSLNFTKEICDSLRYQNVESQNEYERQAQNLMAWALATKTYMTATIPCLFSFFAGAWSDTTGRRKILVIVPLVGQILACFNNMLNKYFFYELSLRFLVVSEGLLEAFTGSWCIMFLSIFAYISTITTNETRTFRLGLVNFSLTVAFPIGSGMSGIVLRSWDFYGTYSIVAGLHLINLLYSGIFVKDPERTSAQMKHDGLGFVHFLRTFFDLTNIKETLKVVFKKAPNNRRTRMCVLLAVVCVLFGPMYGEMSIMYLSTRYRFNWDEVKFSIFQTYNFITHTIGTIFSITVFSKYLQWHDSILGIISTISKIAASFVYCFAPNEKIFYIAPLVDILNGTSLLAMRSIISKLVEPFELGKVNSIVGLTENLMPLVYVSLYTKVYTSTMEVLPGFVFLMGALMTIPAVIVFIWLLYEHRKGVRRLKHNEAEIPIKHEVD